ADSAQGAYRFWMCLLVWPESIINQILAGDSMGFSGQCLMSLWVQDLSYRCHTAALQFTPSRALLLGGIH
ncbi:hypothetical protein, partial [Ideonella sp.]|uniref:hypothetical protein n=1 Tax=Ideonella sp. TaxID=1929293 RepID=UPI0037BE3ACE